MQKQVAPTENLSSFDAPRRDIAVGTNGYQGQLGHPQHAAPVGPDGKKPQPAGPHMKGREIPVEGPRASESDLVSPTTPVLADRVNVAACTLAVQRKACTMYLAYNGNDGALASKIIPWKDLDPEIQSHWCAAAVATHPLLNNA